MMPRSASGPAFPATNCLRSGRTGRVGGSRNNARATSATCSSRENSIMARPVTIVGGGLAGLALGIGLRQRDVPVTICEAGTYPRHRVCGEFISGRGQAALARLGLRPLLDQAGAVSAHTAAFFSTTRATGPRRLPAAALCLSRFILDAALAKKFQQLGGELQTGTRWTAAEVHALACPDRLKPELEPEGIVQATGRRW